MADKTNADLMRAALDLRAEGLLSFDQTVEVALKLAYDSSVQQMVDSFHEVQYLAEQQLIEDITVGIVRLF